MPELVCPDTGTTYPSTVTTFRGPEGSPLDVVHDYPTVSRALFDGRLGSLDLPWVSGVWRFKELVYPSLPMEDVVTRPEGNTPQYRSPSIAAYTGVADVALKHEGMNPTGSFKDRGMTVAVSQAKHIGARAVVCASTGNTSAAVAAYASIAGMKAVILVPEKKTALGKLCQAMAYGARTVMIRGDFDDAMSLVQEASEPLGLYLLNSINPFRLEGQKAIMLELLQQRRWDPPDWIVVPAGNLGNTSAFGKALVEAHRFGLIERIPRILSVQASGASPFSRSFAGGFHGLDAMTAKTVATAIQIGNPVSYGRAVRAIRGTNGVVIDVDDDAILDAKAVVDAAGIGAEPASCATVAGLRMAVREGIIAPDASVVGILTGNLLKDPDTTIAYHRGDYGGTRQNAPVTITATLDDLRRVLGD